ncbi:hypothetical protein ACVGXP_23200, partial [Enterobacter hormaechei]
LDVNSIAQPFSVGYGHNEYQGVVACKTRKAKSRFSFCAIADGHTTAIKLPPFKGNRIVEHVA